MGSGLRRRLDFNVIQSSVLFAVRNAFEANRVAGAKRNACDAPPRRRISVRLRRRQMIVGNPFIDDPLADKHAKLRFAIILIKIFDVQFVSARGTLKSRAGRTFLHRWRTLDGLSARSGFAWNNVDRYVSLQLHRLSFDTAGIMPDAPVLIS